MLASVTEDTRESYGAGLLRFTQFCDAENVPENARMPASESLLSLFVAKMGAGLVQPPTINTWLAGLGLWWRSIIACLRSYCTHIDSLSGTISIQRHGMVAAYCRAPRKVQSPLLQYWRHCRETPSRRSICSYSDGTSICPIHLTVQYGLTRALHGGRAAAWAKL